MLQHRNGAPKKLVIKNFSAKAAKSPADRDANAWKKLRNATEAIFEFRAVEDSLEELYRACENICMQKGADELYRTLAEVCEKHVISKRDTILSEEWHEAQPFLKYLNVTWDTFCKQIIVVRSIFLYLDRTYVMQTPSLLSIWDMSMNLFRDHVVIVPHIREHLVSGLLELILDDRRERNLGTERRDLVRSLVRMLTDLGLYRTLFEAHMLQDASSFYSSESTERMSVVDSVDDVGGTIAGFLAHVGSRIKEEQERCSSSTGYLDVGSRKELVGIVEDKLIRQNVGILLSRGFTSLMVDSRIEDLKSMYDLLSRVNALERLKSNLSDYIKDKGLQIVQNKERDDTMVQSLLDFKSHIDHILAHAFHGNESFANAVKESFESFINVRQNKPAELIAKYIDGLLRPSKRDEADVEAALDQCLILFRFVQGKDVFEAFYKNDLARRLLLNKSASVDSEKSMLSKLKLECGSGFTSKLEAMFKDVDVSKNLTAVFKAAHKNLPIELNVNVLTAASWPTQRSVQVQLPDELMSYLRMFEASYKKNHKGRNLTWQHTLSSCAVKADFPKGSKELSMSLLQTVIVLHFNFASSLTYQELKGRTGLDDAELLRNLQSLACGKVRVLTKAPKGKDVDPTDSFSVNDSFENSQYKIKINTIQLKETKEEQVQTSEKALEERHYMVDAAIVRVMKMRKTMKHNSLISEVVEQIKVPYKIPDMKKRIESLIEREYMSRDEKDSSLYHYVA